MKIFVRVKLKAKSEKVEEINPNHFEVFVKEPPIEGRANKSVIKLLAEHLGIPQACLNIISGHRNRNKVIEIKN